jgi:hypothetical protein
MKYTGARGDDVAARGERAARPLHPRAPRRRRELALEVQRVHQHHDGVEPGHRGGAVMPRPVCLHARSYKLDLSQQVFFSDTIFTIIAAKMIPRDQKNGLERRASCFFTICDKNQLLNKKKNGKDMAILVPRWV